MIAMPDLVDALTANLTPVRRLRPPLTRAACWLLLAAAILGLLAIAEGLRPDLAARLSDPRFVVRVVAALSTGILAAVAAFMLSLPDRSRYWLMLPVPAFGLWLSVMGYQCLTDWVSIGPDGIQIGEAARCFATLVLTSLPLSLAMLIMLRYAAPLRPIGVALMGSLAVAAVTATALSLFHEANATMMILMFNLGTAALFVGLSSTFARKMFSWVAPRTTPFGK